MPLRTTHYWNDGPKYPFLQELSLLYLLGTSVALRVKHLGHIKWLRASVNYSAGHPTAKATRSSSKGTCHQQSSSCLLPNPDWYKPYPPGCLHKKPEEIPLPQTTYTFVHGSFLFTALLFVPSVAETRFSPQVQTWRWFGWWQDQQKPQLLVACQWGEGRPDVLAVADGEAQEPSPNKNLYYYVVILVFMYLELPNNRLLTCSPHALNCLLPAMSEI